jgi:hypothetical protein
MVNRLSNKGDFVEAWNDQRQPLTHPHDIYSIFSRHDMQNLKQEDLEIVKRFIREKELCDLLVQGIPKYVEFPRNKEYVDSMFKIKYEEFIGRKYLLVQSIVHPECYFNIFLTDAGEYRLSSIINKANLSDIVKVTKRIWEILHEVSGYPRINFNARYPWWTSLANDFSSSFAFERSSNRDIKPRPNDQWYIQMLQNHEYYDQESGNIFWLLENDLKEMSTTESISSSSKHIRQSIRSSDNTDSVGTSSVTKEIDDSEGKCIICFVNKPETLVLPCLHKVVCIECSDRLKTDPLNKYKCIICRSNIVFISEERQ